MTSTRHGPMKRMRLWENLPLGLKGLAVVAIPVGALLFAAVFSYRATDRPISEELFVTRYLQGVQTDLQDVFNLMQDAETGVRSFLVTENSRFLRIYFTARTRLPDLIAELEANEEAFAERDLGFDDPEARGARSVALGLTGVEDLDTRLRRVERLSQQRFEDLTTLVEYGRSVADDDPFNDLPNPGVPDLFAGRVAFVQAIRPLIDDVSVHLVELPAAASAEQAEAREEQLRQIVLISILGMVAGAIAMILFTRTITRRVVRLEAGAKVLAQGAEMPLLPTGKDVIGRLSDELGKAARLLEVRSHGLMAAKQEADTANQAKSEFLSRMSHELRTPLNAILGFGQLLQMDALDPQQRQNVEQIVRAGRHLLELINEVLDIARVESGRAFLSVEPIPLREVLEEAVDLVRPLALERELTLSYEPPPDALAVRADKQRLRQVLLNLLSNAVKFNRPEGSVTVTTTAADEHVEIAVSDTGRGIAAERLDRLFVPFDRLGAEQGEIEGTGLGLALSKTLLEAMGGDVTASSRVGEGSTFTVSLDRAHLTAPDASPAASESPPQTSPVTTTRVLYIEDNSSNLELVELALSRTGIGFVGASSGSEGLSIARVSQPDAILLDLDLPDVSGSEVLQRLKSDATTAPIPVVIVTADAMQVRRDELLAAGAAAYVVKPFEVRELIDVVTAAVAGRAT